MMWYQGRSCAANPRDKPAAQHHPAGRSRSLASHQPQIPAALLTAAVQDGGKRVIKWVSRRTVIWLWCVRGQSTVSHSVRQHSNPLFPASQSVPHGQSQTAQTGSLTHQLQLFFTQHSLLSQQSSLRCVYTNWFLSMCYLLVSYLLLTNQRVLFNLLSSKL